MEEKTGRNTKPGVDGAEQGEYVIVEITKKLTVLKVSALIFFIMFLVFFIVSFLFRIYFFSPVFLIFLIILPAFSGFAGRAYYLRVLHTVFSYNNKSFEIKVGVSESITHRWEDFKLVSLFHLGKGDYSIRLRPDITADFFVDIPTSKIGLDSHEFRFKVSDFIDEAQKIRMGEKRIVNKA